MPFYENRKTISAVNIKIEMTYTRLIDRSKWIDRCLLLLNALFFFLIMLLFLWLSFTSPTFVLWILKPHLVHSNGIILGQHLFQRISYTGKFEFVWRLAIDFVTQYFSCSFAFFHIQRANGSPADASHPLEIWLVHILLT